MHRPCETNELWGGATGVRGEGERERRGGGMGQDRTGCMVPRGQ